MSSEVKVLVSYLVKVSEGANQNLIVDHLRFAE